MDDDMKSINLTTDSKLETKLSFFYKPYNQYQKLVNFYMKFGDEHKESFSQKTGKSY